MSTRWPTLIEDGDGLLILDQTCLPREAVMLRLATLDDVVKAIRVMQVRGAPLIGATDDAGDARLADVITILAATRPTAVNLHWALARMRSVLEKSAPATRRNLAWQEARAIATEDEAANGLIGKHGLALLELRRQGERSVNVMTHCNAGRLATVEHGTALAPVYAAHAADVPVHVWVSETRPRNQGLLAARAHGVPFYVAAPLSTIDFACASGAQIPIEERAAEELGAGAVPAANPAFDVTPAVLISGIISERGIAAAGALEQWTS